jgi:hypothetical protein
MSEVVPSPDTKIFTYQEKTSMKKMLLVLCAVMVCSLLASAQISPTVYNRTFVGYCNGVHAVLQKLASSGEGSSKVFVGGYDDILDACGYPYNSPIVGQKHGIGSTVPPHFGSTGTVLDIADGLEDAVAGTYTGIQIEYLLNVTNNVFAGYYGNTSDIDYWYLYDSMANGLPSKTNSMTKLPTITGKYTKR